MSLLLRRRIRSFGIRAHANSRVNQFPDIRSVDCRFFTAHSAIEGRFVKRVHIAVVGISPDLLLLLMNRGNVLLCCCVTMLLCCCVGGLPKRTKLGLLQSGTRVAIFPLSFIQTNKAICWMSHILMRKVIPWSSIQVPDSSVLAFNNLAISDG